jgi:hypothetical protein
MNGKSEKCKYQVKNTMYRIFRGNNQNGKKYGQKGDEVKCTHGLYFQNTLTF